MGEIPTKKELMAEISTEWNHLEARLAGLEEAQMTSPCTVGDWSVKDMLAHLSFWEKFLLDRIGSALSGQPAQYPPLLSMEDVDQLNVRCLAESQPRTLSAVVVEFRSLYTAVLTVMEALDEAHLSLPVLIDYPQDNLHVWEIVRANTSDHYAEHRLQLEQAFPSKPT